MPRRSVMVLCAALVLILTVSARSPGREIIIDTDMGLDDVRALFVLLADSATTVNGILTVEGSASLGKGTDNLIGLLETLERDDIAVYCGARRAGTEPPIWRRTADALAGVPFAPPRHITALDLRDGFHDLLYGSGDRPRYLALGPLGNLASMDDGTMGGIESIWIPGVVDGNRLEGWNLSFDPESAFDVLNRAVRIVIVDVGPARGIDADSLLSSVGGSSEAARWIERILSGARGHLIIYDEIAALAAIRPDLTIIDPARFRMGRKDGDGFTLERDDGGPIRIARIADMNAAARGLAALWETEAEHGHHHDNDAEHLLEAIDPELYIKTFHGHLGPYLVLGYRMGRTALRELDSEGHFGLSVVVHSRLQPPASCLIDGVQLGSGCTLGKRNIEIAGIEGPAYAEFASERGERITIHLRADVPRLVADLIRESGVEEAGDRLFHMGEESLFEVRRE